MNFTILLLFAGVLALALPIMIGTYVYKDAKRRNMDAILWTVVSLLVPGLIGLIIYLVVRGSSAEVICPACEKEVAVSHVICPYCGNPLKPSCRNCKAILEPTWKLCPQCGTEILEEDISRIRVPKPRKDKGIKLLISLLIAVPLTILIIGIMGLILFRVNIGSSGSVGMSSVYACHLDAEQDSIPQEVRDWIAECDKQGEGVYVLQLSPEYIAENDIDIAIEILDPSESVYCAYVYINQYQGEGLTCDLSVGSNSVEIRYGSSFDEEDALVNGYELSGFFVAGPKIEVIQVFINGELFDAIITNL